MQITSLTIAAVGLMTTLGAAVFCNYHQTSPRLSAAILNGRPFPQSNSKGSWKYERMSLSLRNRRLRIVLTGSSPAEYVIGIRSSDERQASLVAGKVEVSGNLPKYRKISEITDWPKPRISITPGVLRIAGLTNGKGSLIAYIVVPRGTKTRIDVFGRNIIDTEVSDSRLIHSGVTVRTEVRGVNSLVSELIHAPSGSTQGRKE